METTTTTPILAMERGTYVRVKNNATVSYNNKIAKIADRVSTEARVWVTFLNQDYDSGLREFQVAIADLEVLPDQDAAPQQQLLEAWESRYKNVLDRLAKTQTGIEKLGQFAMEVADNHNYCDEYDNVVEAVNQSLRDAGYGLVQLPVREQEYEVQVNVRATIWGSTTVMVTARCEEDAMDQVRDDPDSYTNIDDLLSDSLVNERPDYDIEVEMA